MKMSQTHDPIYRTSPARTVKMMAIMLGICIAGGAIFFAMWDYWISAPPPVVAMMAGDSGSVSAAVVPTGVEIPVDLSFVESSDFRTLAFNALPGEPDNNPTITAEVGDRIVFDVLNDGVTYHSFGVTASEEGTVGVFPDSVIGTINSPINPGDSGQSEFIPPEEGVYYYICTITGHREQGMVGQIIVGDAEAPEPEPEPVMAPKPAPVTAIEITPVEHEGMISIPPGSALVGCDDTRECYIPADVITKPGVPVTWSNDDTAAHTVTSGIPAEGPDGVFDSSLFIAGATFEHTFDEPGEYPYYCIVHPWMLGSVTVE